MSRWCCRLALALSRRGLGVALLWTFALVHPLLHGTPLDGGGLDALHGWLLAWAVADREA